jgi:hypothetical protein
MWAGRDVFGPLSANVGPFSMNAVLNGPLFSINLVPKARMFSGPGVYVFRSLQIYTWAARAKCFAVILSFIVGAGVVGFCLEHDGLEQLLQQVQALEPWPAGEAYLGSGGFQRKQPLGVARPKQRWLFEAKRGGVHSPHYGVQAALNQANASGSTAPGSLPSAARRSERKRRWLHQTSRPAPRAWCGWGAGHR